MNENDEIKCLECHSPYELRDNSCHLCNELTEYYEDKECHQINETCTKQINKEECIECKDNHVLSEGKCIEPKGECSKLSKTTCDTCKNDLLSIKGNCEINQQIKEKCIYSINNLTETKCITCKQQYGNNNGECEENEECSHYYLGRCLKQLMQ